MVEDFYTQIKALIQNIDYIQLGLFVFILIIGFIGRKIAMKSATYFFRMLDKRTKKQLFDEYLSPILKPIGNFVVLLSLFVGIKIIAIPSDPYPIKEYLLKLLGILFILNIAWFLSSVVNILMLYLEKITTKTESKLDDQLVPILRKFLRAIIYIMAGLLILQNLGYSVSGLLAGIGLGGFALAFASKDALSNIFGSLVIFMDRPFHIGDWIKTSNYEGIVEEVGLRSTKIRTFEKTIVTVPNSQISTQIVENVSKRPQRRISFNLGIEYSTPASKVQRAVDTIREILKNDPRVDQEFWIVNFSEFAASSLNIFIYFFTKTVAWLDYMQIKEEINLKIMQALEKMEIGIAFPSTSVYIEKWPEKPEMNR
jgi:MscS family membrane protein